MKNERSVVYTLILGVCMLLSLLLIGKMLLGHPQTPTQQPSAPPGESTQQTEPESKEKTMEVELTENDLSELISSALPFTPDNLTVKIAKDETITVGASVSKQSLNDSGLVTGAMRTAVMFLPDPCDMSGAWQAGLQDGALTLQTQKIEVAGFSLPEKLTASLTDQVTRVVNSQLAAWGITAAGLRCDDGVLYLAP